MTRTERERVRSKVENVAEKLKITVLIQVSQGLEDQKNKSHILCLTCLSVLVNYLVKILQRRVVSNCHLTVKKPMNLGVFEFRQGWLFFIYCSDLKSSYVCSLLQIK